MTDNTSNSTENNQPKYKIGDIGIQFRPYSA